MTFHDYQCCPNWENFARNTTVPLTFPLDHWLAPAYGKLLLLVGIRTNLCRISPNFLILEDLKPGKLGYFQVQGTSQVHLFRHFLPDSSPRTCNKYQITLHSTIFNKRFSEDEYNLKSIRYETAFLYLNVFNVPIC